MSKFVAVHYHEIALKGRNRAHFVRVLVGNLERALKPLGATRVQSVEGRILVHHDGDEEVILTRAQRVFGAAHVMAVVEYAPDALEEIAKHIIRDLRARAPSTFRISTRRHDKKFPLRSVDLDRKLGAIVHEATGTPVSLKSPEFEAFALILDGRILLGTDKRVGAGGLPTGTGGRVMALLSGGIDSPVAAWRLMKRGCRADFVHFHSHPIVDRRSIEKAEELVEELLPWQFQARLHLAPLAEIQKAIRLSCDPRFRVVLYRRFMIRIAERLGRRQRCRALVTGESVAQVASQTLRNLDAVDCVAMMPVLRPVIAYDKQEIVDEAQRLGTYEISIQPDQDCCKLFLPEKPVIHARRWQCEAEEEKLDVMALVQDAVTRTELRRVQV